MNVAVIGSGGIGGLYGGKLYQAGVHVTMVCRSDYEVIRDRGITVESIWGSFHYRPHKVVRSVSECDPIPDYLLVCTKAVSDDTALKLLEGLPEKSDEVAVVLLQNGIYIEEPVKKFRPDLTVIGGIAFVCTFRTQPGYICHTDYGRIVLGDYPQGVSKKTRLLADTFKKAGVPCEVTEDIIRARWGKLVWNAAFNPLSVLAGGKDTGEIVSDPYLLNIARSVMEEVVRLADADGHPLSPAVVDENLEATRAMSPYKTSMLLDYEKGRPMECEAILGKAVKKAEELGVETPTIRTLYNLLMSFNRKLGGKNRDV
ncbi:ketopantoate reductase family protein [Thermodesulforhabdus norvegica]|uniref:2-dehydropantoate 2-reductase n=1 Tax=Thermodesulforhabdus norvegica TaxID=39841 RepID=A0A1I4RBH5_9BACT|nr:2-dehydropantoate 2-reductase [Thermodesulforhabdus norvegica]SFM49223.1 2-dehydropantoate 2-reductase [Thermodesulforhabdus norvegica]